MDTATRYRIRKQGISWRELDGQIVVLDLESSKYVTVNGAGAVIWERLIPGATLDEIVNELVEVFDIDVETARSDSEAFLDELRTRRMLYEKT
jgi:hypothetical protein